MALRFCFALGVLSLGGAALACTTTVIQQAAPGPSDDGGVPDPTPDPGLVDAGADAALPPFVFKAAPPGTFAQAVSVGGSVVAAPKIVPIMFTGDPQQQLITGFATKLATTAYWGQIAGEYGVGALTAKAPIIVSDVAPPTISDNQIVQWLTSKFSSDPAHFGTPDSQTLYIVYYPDGTSITQGGTTSCTSFGGYHGEAQALGKPYSYAVIPRCATFAGLGTTDITTFTSSHEILEWATDPFPQTSPAYMLVDDEHAVWSKAFLGELGDLCAQMGDMSASPADLGYSVQRTWSNVSARAGHHPCVPVAKTPYFTAFPSKPDIIPVTDMFGRSIMTQGFKVGVGQSRTIELTMYSDGAMPSWSVQMVDLTTLTGGTPEFSYKLNKSKGTSGDTLQLTITGELAATKGQGVLLVSQTTRETNLWPVWITN